MYHNYIETMSSYVRCLVSTGNHRIEIHSLNVMIHNEGKLKFNDNFNIWRQLEHFEYEMNRTLLEASKSIWKAFYWISITWFIRNNVHQIVLQYFV